MGELDQFGQPDDDAEVVVVAGDPLFSGVVPTDQTFKFSDVQLLAPVIPRSKIVGIAHNNAAHAKEVGAWKHDNIHFFLKPNTAVIGPDDTIRYPDDIGDIDYEPELAVVIGRICKDVPVELAKDVIFGLTIANDVTARELSRVQDSGHFARAKGFDTFAPLGPWIETDFDVDAVRNGLKISTYLNGDQVQSGTTADLIWHIPEVIAHVSHVMTLLPGDVILTGSSAGVGPMAPGDEVEISIEGLGNLTNKVALR